jgi:hypothetical protein
MLGAQERQIFQAAHVLVEQALSISLDHTLRRKLSICWRTTPKWTANWFPKTSTGPSALSRLLPLPRSRSFRRGCRFGHGAILH